MSDGDRGVMADQPAVSVIVPAYNAGATLAIQLEALAAQEDSPSFEVIVADNGSTDGTRALVEQFDSGRLDVRVVDAGPPGTKQGANPARNAGAAAAHGRLLLFCDSDDEVSPMWCAGLARALGQYDAATGPLDLASFEGRRPDPDDPLLLDLDGWDGFLPFAWSCSVGVRADVFAEIGGFDETHLRGGDDVEFSWRLQLRGHTLGFAPDAVLRYRLAQGSDRARREFRNCQDEPRLYREFRAAGMPSGQPLAVWLRLIGRRAITVVRRPRNPRARAALLLPVARLSGLVVGSVRHRCWYLGRRVVL